LPDENIVNTRNFFLPQQMTDKTPIRVVLVDDHLQIHRIVQVTLGAISDIRLVGQGAAGQEGIDLCEQYQPDIAPMDVLMPVMDGIEATRVLHERLPEIKILVLSSFQDHENVYAMLREGVVGYLTKDSLAEDLADTIRATFQGKMVFSSEDGAHLVAPPQPAPVIESLEWIAAHRERRDPSQRQLFAAIATCGFPEAHHCVTALAICETFTWQAGFEWAGSLALGGGEMVNGAALVEAGGMTIRIRKALELAAEALAQGQAVPKAVEEMMATPVTHNWTYRLMGGLGWLQRAKHYGGLKQLRRKPYLTKTN
jgi:DNA-binding NarL/FixJ family response regulator